MKQRSMERYNIVTGFCCSLMEVPEHSLKFTCFGFQGIIDDCYNSCNIRKVSRYC